MVFVSGFKRQHKSIRRITKKCVLCSWETLEQSNRQSANLEHVSDTEICIETEGADHWPRGDAGRRLLGFLDWRSRLLKRPLWQPIGKGVTLLHRPIVITLTLPKNTREMMSEIDFVLNWRWQVNTTDIDKPLKAN